MIQVQRGIAALCALFILQGCAAVQVERAKDLSSAGVAYADATAAVIDVAIDSAIDAESEAEVRRAPRQSMLPLNEALRKQRTGELEQLDEGTIKTVVLYAKLKSSVIATKAYFQALQDLANGSTAEATGEAVKSLALRVNGISQALDEKDAISKPKAEALGGLAKLVAAQVHGAKLANALERDAPLIGRALLIQQHVLSTASDDIGNKLAEANNRFFVDKVQAPHAKGVIEGEWVNNRRTYIKVKAFGQVHASLKQAKATAEQMQKVWERILSGDFNAKEIGTMLKETEELLNAIYTLKNADKPK